MVSFDSNRQVFKGAASKDPERMLAEDGEGRWWFNVPVDNFSAQDHLFNPVTEVEMHFGGSIDFKGKSVLNLGPKEGFFMFFAEAMGASRVVGIEDPAVDRSVSARFQILKELLGSQAEYYRGDFNSQVNDDFDIVLVSHSLNYTAEPRTFLKNAAARAKEQIWILSHLFIDDSDVPSSVLLRSYSSADSYAPKTAFNLAWLIHAVDNEFLAIKHARLHPSQRYLSLACDQRADMRQIRKVSYAEMPLDEDVTQTAALVMSCKKFEQLWDPFFILFKRFWPDCPYKIYFCTDVGSYPGVQNITIGEDLGWTGNCLFALQQLKEKRVLLFQEDFLLQAPVETERVRKYVAHAARHDVSCLRLYPCPGPTADWIGSDELGTLQPLDDYRMSLQLALWKKELLAALLVPGETPWQLEIHGTQRAALRPEIFLSVREGCPVPYYATAVVKGEWQDAALELLDREGIPRSHINKRVY